MQRRVKEYTIDVDDVLLIDTNDSTLLVDQRRYFYYFIFPNFYDACDGIV